MCCFVVFHVRGLGSITITGVARMGGGEYKSYVECHGEFAYWFWLTVFVLAIVAFILVFAAACVFFGVFLFVLGICKYIKLHISISSC